jgi:hypothetical protein
MRDALNRQAFSDSDSALVSLLSTEVRKERSNGPEVVDFFRGRQLKAKSAIKTVLSPKALRKENAAASPLSGPDKALWSVKPASCSLLKKVGSSLGESLVLWAAAEPQMSNRTHKAYKV